MNTEIKAVKIIFKGTVRRVGVGFFTELTWDAFCHKLRDLFHEEMSGLEDASRLRVAYLDNDNDLVTVSSTPELQEAFSSTSAKTIRLEILRKGGDRSPFTTISATLQAAGEQVRRHTATIANSEALALLDKGDIQGALNRLEEAAIEVVKKAERAPILWYNLACVRARANNLRGAIDALENSVKNGYTGLQTMMEDVDLDPIRRYPEFLDVIRRTVENMKKDIPETACSVCNDVVASLTQARLDAASELSKILTEVFPKDCRSFYNAGCVESLSGNAKAAADYVKQAVQRGFNDTKHFLEDPDFENVRNSVVLKEVMDTLNAASTEATKIGRDIQNTIVPSPNTPQEPCSETAKQAKSLFQTFQTDVTLLGAQLQKDFGAFLFPQQEQQPAATVPSEAPTVPSEAPIEATITTPPKPDFIPSLALPVVDQQQQQPSAKDTHDSVEVQSLSSSLTEPLNAEVEEQSEVVEKYGAQMQKLREMGFQMDTDVLRRILEVHNGDVGRAAAQILEA